MISEAISCGLPVIISDIPENKYLIDNTINGFVVNHQDPLSISDGIYKYINLSPHEKEKMAIENRKKADKLFDKKKIYKDYLNMISNL